MSTDLHTLSGAFALDALSAEEAAEFRKHLQGCAACRQEVRELRAAAAQMGAAEATAPPAHLRALVLDAASRVPQLPPKVAPIERVRTSRWSRRLLAAAAAVVVLLGGVIGVSQMIDDDPQLPAAVSQVFGSSDARTAAVGTDHGTIRVAASPERNEMALDTRDLAPLEGDRVYQLWAVLDGTPTSAAVLEDTAAGIAMPMPGPEVSVAITVEPAGGSSEPTTEPFVRLDPNAI